MTRLLASWWNNPNGLLFISIVPFLLCFSLLRITVGWIGYIVVPPLIRRWFTNRYYTPGGLRRQPYNHWTH